MCVTGRSVTLAAISQTTCKRNHAGTPPVVKCKYVETVLKRVIILPETKELLNFCWRGRSHSLLMWMSFSKNWRHWNEKGNKHFQSFDCCGGRLYHELAASAPAAPLYNSCDRRGVCSCDNSAGVPAAGHVTTKCCYSIAFSSFNFHSAVCNSSQFNTVNCGSSESSLFWTDK